MGRPLRWTTDLVAEMCRRVDAGERYESIGESYGISASGVYKVLFRSGSRQRQSINTRKKWTNPLVKSMYHRYFVGGESVDVLANEHGVTPGAIKGLFHKRGLPFRMDIKMWKHTEVIEAHKRISSGEDLNKVAGDYGVSYQSLYAAFRRFGLHTRAAFRTRRSRDSLGRKIWQLRRDGKTYQQCADIVGAWSGKQAKHNAAMTLRRYCERNNLPMPIAGSASASTGSRSSQADAR